MLKLISFSKTNSNKITLLSIIESIIAVTVTIYIAIDFGTLFYIALSASIAPFLMMKSKESKEKGLGIFCKLKELLDKTSVFFRKFHLPGLILGQWFYVFVVLLSSITIKFIVTLSFFIKGIKSIPKNWVRIVLCTDFTTPLEIIPGYGGIPIFPYSYNENAIPSDQERYSEFKYRVFICLLCFLIGYFCINIIEFYNTYKKANVGFAGPDSVFEWLLFFILMMVGIFNYLIAIINLPFMVEITCYILAVVYRFSLKSTSFLWLPLVYVVNETFDDSISIKGKLKILNDSSIEKLKKYVSWVTIVVMAFKIILLPRIIIWWNSNSWSELLNVYIMPNEIHPWHIAATLNALVTIIGFYLFFEKASLYLEEGKWDESQVKKMYNFFCFIRGIISIYTISIGLYLTINVVISGPLPSFSFNLCP